MIYPRSSELRRLGFTLVEAMVVMGLLAIFLTVLASLFTTAINLEGSSSGYSAVVDDGRFIMARLDYDIARATSITTPAALGANAANLVMTINSATYTYALNGSNLQLTDGTGSANLNGNRTTITGLNFQRIGTSGDKESIRYTFTVTGTIQHPNQTDTQTYTSTVERR
jgi:type II secretory pathway component PulJ